MSRNRNDRIAALPPGRLASLDGLRGVASVVVLFHHSLLVVPALAGVYFGIQPLVGTKAWVAAYTPLHLAWAGTEAVYLFFILSGLVLVIQAMKNPRFAAWVAYYPRRLLRLYLPIWGAIAFAFITFAVFKRTPFDGESVWLQVSSLGYSGNAVHQDMMMVLGTSNTVTPLWSLYWEILFSLTLPVYVLFAGIGHRYLFWPKLAIVVAVMVYGATGGGDFYFYLPMFGIGALFASHWTWMSGAFSKVATKHWFWWPFIVIALAFSVSRWLVPALDYSLLLPASRLTWLETIGTAMLVLAAGFWPVLRRTLERRFFQWLGVISFSLYLVHEPIVKAVQYVFAGQQSATFTIPVSIGAALFVAMVFSRFIELPAHRLSQRFGRWIISMFPSRPTETGMHSAQRFVPAQPQLETELHPEPEPVAVGSAL